MVLKLVNKGFTVDSLLRLGHMKAVNPKTTVLHYLVRLVKKNGSQVLDFHAGLQSGPLAAREEFETINLGSQGAGREDKAGSRRSVTSPGLVWRRIRRNSFGRSLCFAWIFPACTSPKSTQLKRRVEHFEAGAIELVKVRTKVYP
ncbi:hypothetical protein PsorP6_011864 [Peronosclerospora sorghi]|uniref:Uncharacterized protein n=1 Tax=Peronosclerospora sorghi TaxID=230839 RepID=A0ACC0WK01_9STRA|nr:hypothetical protein PsorP6_011864 [Peronosclerospora sorghi]